ncbi:GNAT family N-acetyltransferase [Pseudonocardia nematodicida]|uniref:Lysine N-acyltransferase MbtK n=1 Tax=Pseudonocardia nematodicida TaxID=1206997 RepID=A0ABV1K6J8_9PSEU
MPDPQDVPDGPITFRPLTPTDLPMLRDWLAEPHVARWWNHETTLDAVERDFGPAMRGEDPSEDLVVSAGGVPVGLLQRCRWHDFPEYVVEIAPILTVPDGAVTIDYLIGPPGLTGRGLGTRILAAAAAGVWERYPDAPAIIVPVSAGNRASWRALEKAGFRRVASGDLPPDNPIDPPLSHVHRLDRPTTEEPACRP